MTVKELKDLLDTYPDDFLVVMSKDSEGNEFSPLSEVEVGQYLAASTYSGEFVTEEVDYSDSVCLWPIN